MYIHHPLLLTDICHFVPFHSKIRFLGLNESEKSSSDVMWNRPHSNQSSVTFSSADPDYSRISRCITPEIAWQTSAVGMPSMQRKYENLVKIKVSGQCPVCNQRRHIDHCSEVQGVLVPILVAMPTSGVTTGVSPPRGSVVPLQDIHSPQRNTYGYPL